MGAITLAVTIYTVWTIIELPKEVAFLVPGLLSVLSWVGIRRSIAVSAAPAVSRTFRFTKSLILVALTFFVVFWLQDSSATIHTYIVNYGFVSESIPYIVMGLVLPPVAFLLFGIISDRGHERVGFILGMGLLIIGIGISLLSEENVDALLIPLGIADGLGGTYAEFFILTLPIFFLSVTKRPVFIASLGIAIDLFYAAIEWEVAVWQPDILLYFDVPVLIIALVSSIVFIILAYFLFERHRETTLAASIWQLVYEAEGASALPGLGDEEDRAPLASAQAGLFLPEEQRIAALLVEGYTKGEIARKLNVPSAVVQEQMSSLRSKVAGANQDPADEQLARVARDFKLTGREAQTLRGLYEGHTNVEIAAEHFISEETVKFHVKNLMRKLPVNSRTEIREWLLSSF
jgi:DNA-binding NarL/FixJ family response regulator